MTWTPRQENNTRRAQHPHALISARALTVIVGDVHGAGFTKKEYFVLIGIPT